MKTKWQRWTSLRYQGAWSALGFVVLLAGCSEDDGANPSNLGTSPAVTDGTGNGMTMPAGVGGNVAAGAAGSTDAAAAGVSGAASPPVMTPPVDTNVGAGTPGLDMAGLPGMDMGIPAMGMAGMPGIDMAGMPGMDMGMAGAPGLDMAGMPGMDMGMAGAEGTDPGMEVPVEMRPDLGEGDGSDVITIGDSWMSLSLTPTSGNGIQQSLRAASGQPYRAYGIPGTRMLAGSILGPAIPDQYTGAKGDNADIKTVVMTGGGNDIIQVPGLQEDCDAGGDTCGTEIGKILDSLSSLWAEMAADGVQDVIYVQYSDPEGNDIDFVVPDGDGVPKRCAEVPAPLRCHRLETNVLVMQDIPDGIHPSAAGYTRIGEAVYEMMVEQGMRR